MFHFRSVEKIILTAVFPSFGLFFKAFVFFSKILDIFWKFFFFKVTRFYQKSLEKALLFMFHFRSVLRASVFAPMLGAAVEKKETVEELYVDVVGEIVSCDEMEQEFWRCGSETDAYNKGYAFINMSSPSDAHAAVTQGDEVVMEEVVHMEAMDTEEALEEDAKDVAKMVMSVLGEAVEGGMKEAVEVGVKEAEEDMVEAAGPEEDMEVVEKVMGL